MWTSEYAGSVLKCLRSATIFSAPSNVKIFLQNIAHYAPMWIQEYLYDTLPGKGLDKARENQVAAHKVANQLLEEKSNALATGKAARDVMSILGAWPTTPKARSENL